MPSTITQFQAFVDGQGLIGKVSSFTPPVPAEKTEDFRTGGMLGDVSIQTGFEKLEASMSLEDASPDILNLFGITERGAFDITLRAAEVNERGDTRPIVHQMRGTIRSVDFGTIEAGAKTPTKIDFDVTYYRHASDNRDIIEMDMVNHILRVNGVDRLAEQRAAIGR